MMNKKRRDWKQKTTLVGWAGGLWEIRTLDLFRVKEAL